MLETKPRRPAPFFATAWVVAAIALLRTAPLAAQEPPAPSPATLVERSIEAVGGAEALAAVKTLKITGTTMINGIETPFEIVRQRPAMYRKTYFAESGPQIVATNGEVVWFQGRRRDGSQTPEAIEGDAAQRLLEEEADFDGPLYGYADKGHTLEWVGDSEVDGTPAVHLRLTLASGRVQDWFLDRDEGYVLHKVTPQEHSRAGPYDRNWHFMEYEKVDGIAFPFYSEQEDRQHVRSMTVDSVEVNPEVDPTLFEMPAGE